MTKNKEAVLILLITMAGILFHNVVVKSEEKEVVHEEVFVYEETGRSYEEIKVQVNELRERLKSQLTQIQSLKEELSTYVSDTKKGRVSVASFEGSHTEYLGKFTVTAYDLSEECCSKSRDHESFGITANGYSLLGLSREEAMTIAVDPEVIPLGSKVYLEFEGEYESFSGEYIARDTGGLIKGRKLDLFMGDFGLVESHQSSWDFGIREAEVYLLESGGTY